jgi:hypothetical protein
MTSNTVYLGVGTLVHVDGMPFRLTDGVTADGLQENLDAVCGDCACLTQCGDAYAHSGPPKRRPEMRMSRLAVWFSVLLGTLGASWLMGKSDDAADLIAGAGGGLFIHWLMQHVLAWLESKT